MAGIEPATDGLRNRCSTAELHWPLRLEALGGGASRTTAITLTRGRGGVKSNKIGARRNFILRAAGLDKPVLYMVRVAHEKRIIIAT